MFEESFLQHLKSGLSQKDIVDKDLAYNSLTEEAFKLAMYASDLKVPLVVVKENNYGANHIYELLGSYYSADDIVLYDPEESMRAEAIVASFEGRAKRVSAIAEILTGKPKIIVTTAYGLIRHLPKLSLLEKSIIDIKVGDILERDDLVASLRSAGYERVPTSERPLTYAIRGSIVDVFSANYSSPIRIEFFDDEVDSLRFYDVNTQMTVEKIDECRLIFASDVLFDEEDTKILQGAMGDNDSFALDLDFIESGIYQGHLYYHYAFLKSQAHLLDLLPESLLYLSDTEAIDRHLKMLRDETFAYLREMSEDNNLPLRFYVFADYNRIIDSSNKLSSSPLSQAFPLVTEVDAPTGPLPLIIQGVMKAKETYKVLAISAKEVEEVIEALNGLDVPYKVYTGKLESGITIMVGEVAKGLRIDKLDIAIYSSKELYDRKRKLGRYASKYEESVKLDSYEELTRGDYVVHNQYGIGQYVGIEKRTINNIKLDYLKILYRGNDELLVPLSQFSLVRKYVSKDGVIPKLHKLGSKEWARTKAKVEEGIDDLVERLLSLYQKRSSDIGFAFSPDNDIQRDFENDFPYELTDDQVRSVIEVKKDMEDKKPMDRLLCGDVGFGKTEVAIRAAMKAVLGNKQVAYLCPTTILALQHYKTFVARFESYSVKVALLDRYVRPADQKRITKELKEHKVDIIIGTHRILSKDVQYADLGLLIIDEEQRFGVEHKEKIKELKESIDVLSLSATPIPRTLQMSLVGLRGLSTLDTPPKDRYPIQTYVVEKNDHLIKEVIERELVRGGQVFYLYNDIDRIYNLAHKIEGMVEGIRVIVAHGKMAREELEDAMMAFYAGKADVLICTTIIETGIDIPNTNTIIIDNAQNFGLAQLYQIKGRVGRSDKIAYAYLMVPPKKQLSEVASKRLDAIKEFTALGSGYKIAMRDLAIRGAGDMLGAKQSGFIDNVGLDLYLAMLERAIKRKRGEDVPEEKDYIRPVIPLDSYIPDTFTDNDYDKLDMYHRLDAIHDKSDLLDYYLEVKDKYGRLPKEIDALFEKKEIELFIDGDIVDSFKIVKGHIVLTLTKNFSDTVDGMKLFTYCNELSKDLQIRYTKDKIEFSLQDRREEVKKIVTLLGHLHEVVRT